MKYGFLDNFSIAKMIDDDTLQQLRSYPGIPYTFRIYDNDGTSSTNTKAWRLAALNSPRTEEEVLTLKQRCQL